MADIVKQIMDRYAGFSLKSGDDADINSLTYLDFEEPEDQPPIGGRLVLVLVESRILDAIDGETPDQDLLSRLERFKGDLRAEGMHTRFIRADLYDGVDHKDGLTLLALRRFLIDIREAFPRFEGVVLVGSFPEASLVRRWSWASPHGNASPPWTGGTPHLTIVPESVSRRSEIVLADLTGQWERLYHKEVEIEAWLANATSDMGDGWRNGETILDCTFTSNDYKAGKLTFKDCFYVDDANFTVLRRDDNANPQLIVRVRTPLPHPEVAPEDRSSVNVTARPDISVSRIDASNIAYDPSARKQGTNGERFVDPQGDPNVVPSTDPNLVPANQRAMFTSFNPLLERRLYNQYFDRNHRFRIGGWSHHELQAGVISGTSDFSAANYLGVLKEAATNFGRDVTVDQASPKDYVDFLKTPPAFKYIIAHSNWQISEFDGDYEPDELQSACGGTPFRWKYESGAFRPSFEGQGKIVDWTIHRTLFQHGTNKDAPGCLMIHGGCDVNTVEGTHSHTHDSKYYAPWQNAEGILFGSSAVALLSRAKTFNDAPRGMGAGLGTGTRANFGNAWRHYYDLQAGDAALAPVVVQNKRAYFWSITGDWTLRLSNKNGLGLLSLEGSEIRDEVIHPTQAWIGAWNFDSSRDRHKGTGNYDGSGQDSIAVQSDWGIAIVKHDGTRWTALTVAERDTWFGQWRWDATVNRGRDSIRATGHLTDRRRDQLLVTSSWGMGVLSQSGNSMTSTRTYESGTRIGGWVYDVAKTVHRGIGDFDGDGHDEVLVSSGWGIGLLSLEHNRDIAMHKTGDRLGSWVLDSSRNRVVSIADFDGDGSDEIMIRSDWGIGILKHANGGLKSIAMHAWDSDLGNGCILSNRSQFRHTGRFLGGNQDAMILAQNDAWFILKLSNDRLTVAAKLSEGERYGGWRFNPAQNYSRAAVRMRGNDKHQIVVNSRWGIGVLEVDESRPTVCHALHPYDDVLGNWHLTQTDYIAGPCKTSAASDAETLMIWKRRP
ncbi:hypothetical protein NAP1_05190 [Erythrobacter sp. NAP1]|uniref:FG-GAP repeat domain-containing protein n=1 Tax=Erythrobacter sp. NAP1 TaxID=237727 RepID=UPI0000686F03|nr:VCBS repeat-containing protein [Erythrobacter sp. NAP1]EAQ30144.1 hypothetical protein NAP1_05190 [Erythrobacter sp. NAP1]